MKRLAATAAILMLVTACSAGPPRLSEWESGGGIGLYEASPGQPYAFDDMTLCLDAPGSAVITNVTPIEPSGGFEVVAFSVMPPNDAGTIGHLTGPDQRLHEAGYPGEGPMMVDNVCPDESGEGGGAHTLGIEVAYTAPAAGSTSGFVVTYESGGEMLTAVRPFGLALCTAAAPPESEPIPPECEVRIADMRLR